MGRRMSGVMSAALLAMVTGAFGDRHSRSHPSPKPNAKRRQKRNRGPLNRTQEAERRRRQMERGQLTASNRGLL